MNDKDSQNSLKNQKNNQSNQYLGWSFCPICRFKLPKVQNLKFCMRCGNDLQYLKEHKQLSPKPIKYPQARPIPYQKYLPPRDFFRPDKISDDDIIDIKEHKLWGTLPSLGLPLISYVAMSFAAAGFMALLIFATFDLEALYDLVYNPYFLIISSFFELIFILIPVLYVGRYLQNPTFKNRLGLLGFTVRNYDIKGIIKEILIGLGFAVSGILLVGIVSISIEMLYNIFGVEIISTESDVELIVSSIDILSLILLAITMILIIGTSEEICFRGFMQKGLVKNLGKSWGILLTALIFSMIHLIGVFLLLPDYPLEFVLSFFLLFFPYFSISLMLGLLFYWRNENLIAVIVAHGVYNAIAIILAFIFFGIF